MHNNKENNMILNPVKSNNKLCKNCHNESVLSQGSLDRCYKCGEVYSKRGVMLEDLKTLDNIVLDAQSGTKNASLNKFLFILTA